MVFLTVPLLARVNKHLYRGFIDSLEITVKAGAGGTGYPKYGGAGGQGGCVYCVGSDLQSLRNVIKKNPSRYFAAQNGENSTKQKILGEPGGDCVIEVPVGIAVTSENGKRIGIVNEIGEKCMLARGGPGGNDKSNFLGYQGQMYKVVLDLRLIADVGLIGFPNAGKSTFLKAISKATPKIASYPFTTIKPNIGVMEFKDKRQISVADLPGLIEGAHINIGMGHKFLKHAERTKLLLLIADVSGFALSHKYPRRSCIETVILLNKELEMYNPELLTKPAILAINKIDLDSEKQEFDKTVDFIKNIESNVDEVDESVRPEKFLKFEHIVGISAKYGQDIENLKELVRDTLDVQAELDGTIKSPDELFSELRAKITEHGSQVT